MFKRSFRGGNFGKNYSRRPSFRRNNSSKIHESKFVQKPVARQAEDVFVPQTSFSDLPINTAIKRNIEACGFKSPTPIQDGTIHPILEGRDVIGIANTGTGKTAAFLIPLLDKVSKGTNKKVLIVVPTRELATQIQDQFRTLGKFMNIYSTLCIGGTGMGNQMYELRRNPSFIIGTPGRLKDLIERRALDLSKYDSIVLDEVDRMLDMGFIRDIKYLISLLPAQRQSLFFSATISSEINQLIQSFVTDPVKVSVKVHDTTQNVEQDIVRIQNGTPKIEVLENLLKNDEFKKVLIFGRTKFGVERLSNVLYKKGFKVGSIHGDKPQSKRNQAIRMFKENVIKILVATDVASRGIDIADITHVINYDQPATYEDYIHRIGRTGRADKKGIALTFVE